MDTLPPDAAPITSAPPAASLTEVPIRGPARTPHPGKRGDLTAQLAQALAETPLAEPRTVPAHSPEALIEYWEDHLGEHGLPTVDALDRALIAGNWPNTLLLTLGPRPAWRPWQSGAVNISRIGAPDGEIEYTSMVTDWLCSTGRRAARQADVVDEARGFPLAAGEKRYRLIALPLAAADGGTSFVLCHLSLAPADPSRGWLSS
jgi:hypothetical protein